MRTAVFHFARVSNATKSRSAVENGREKFLHHGLTFASARASGPRREPLELLALCVPYILDAGVPTRACGTAGDADVLRWRDTSDTLGSGPS